MAGGSESGSYVRGVMSGHLAQQRGSSRLPGPSRAGSCNELEFTIVSLGLHWLLAWLPWLPCGMDVEVSVPTLNEMILSILELHAPDDCYWNAFSLNAQWFTWGFRGLSPLLRFEPPPPAVAYAPWCSCKYDVMLLKVLYCYAQNVPNSKPPRRLSPLLDLATVTTVYTLDKRVLYIFCINRKVIANPIANPDFVGADRGR